MKVAIDLDILIPVAGALTSIIIIWLWSAYMTSAFPVLRGKSICLLIAHPDDEAMFFAPTLLALNRPELGNHVKILCLSSGDADGLGHIRKRELEQSGLRLGLRSKDDVVVVEDQNFPDSMSVTWNPKLIANVLTQLFAPGMARTPASQAPKSVINVLVTFDAYGVSSHPNHISLHNGAKSFLRALMTRHAGWECPVNLYTLTTTNVLRKYSWVIDLPLTLALSLGSKKDQKSGTFPTPLFFFSGPSQYWKSRGAMTECHVSQMRWFRWGWIAVSRYMYVNDLKKEKAV